jgi:hypothetical protein
MAPQNGLNITQDSQFIKNRLRELSTLAEMNREIHATMNINELLQILVEKAVIGVNFERGLIYLVDNEFLRCVAFLDRVKKERASTIKNWVGFRMDESAVGFWRPGAVKPCMSTMRKQTNASVKSS